MKAQNLINLRNVKVVNGCILCIFDSFKIFIFREKDSIMRKEEYKVSQIH